MQEILDKHYKRTIEDLEQIRGFTPVMKKVISSNYNKLQQDIKRETNNHEGLRNETNTEEYDI